MKSATPKAETLILQYLGKYKFLTRKQMGRLKIASSNSNLDEPCNDLRLGKCIGVEDLNTHGHVHYLFHKGALRSVDSEAELEDVMYVDAPPDVSVERWIHRIKCISCQIEFDYSAKEHGYEVDFYIRDIDPVKREKPEDSFRKATRIPLINRWFEPDAIFGVNEKLFTFEYENESSTKRAFEKFEKHCEALDLRAIGKNRNQLTSKGEFRLHRSLWVFSKEEVMRNVIKHIQKKADHKYRSGKWFLFKLEDEVIPKLNSNFKVEGVNDYFENWLTISGERVGMFS